MKSFLLTLAAYLLCSAAATAQLLSAGNEPAAQASDSFSPPPFARYQPPRSMEWPVATLGEVEQKQFTVVQHFEYLQRVYNKSATMEPLAKRVPASEFDPESVLRSLISAKLNADREWWLSLWDKASREKIVNAEANLPAGYWPADWPDLLPAESSPEVRKSTAEASAQAPIQLRRWVLTGQVVMITYRLGTGADAGTEYPLVLALSEGKWLATLDYLDDPVMRRLMPGGKAQLTAIADTAAER